MTIDFAFLNQQIEETVAFAKLVESTGIVALGVHGRYRTESHNAPKKKKQNKKRTLIPNSWIIIKPCS